jgi:hypothetical protein
MGESMLGTIGKYGYCLPNSQVATPTVTAHLPSSHAETLNNIRTDASGYNKCLFGSTLEGALKEKSMNGEYIAW